MLDSNQHHLHCCDFRHSVNVNSILFFDTKQNEFSKNLFIFKIYYFLPKLLKSYINESNPKPIGKNTFNTNEHEVHLYARIPSRPMKVPLPPVGKFHGEEIVILSANRKASKFYLLSSSFGNEMKPLLYFTSLHTTPHPCETIVVMRSVA